MPLILPLTKEFLSNEDRIIWQKRRPYWRENTVLEYPYVWLIYCYQYFQHTVLYMQSFTDVPLGKNTVKPGL